MTPSIAAAAIRRIFDSRGDPTIEVEITADGRTRRAAAPSGASTGTHEVRAFPEGGVDAALETFRGEVAPGLLGRDVTEQEELDRLLEEIDGTGDFSRIGGNVAVAVSLATAKSAAAALGVPLYRYIGGSLAKSLPVPMGNVIGGGAHAVGGTDIQEFLSVALGPTIGDSVRANVAVHRAVRDQIKARLPGEPLGRGDEGAWVGKLTNQDAMEILHSACGEVSDEMGFRCLPALDMAASEFYEDGEYVYKEGRLSPEDQVEFVAGLVEDYGLYSVEDPLEEDDFDGFAELTRLVGEKTLVIGDDLFVTDPARVARGIEMGAANAVLIKPNQIGTLSRTAETVRMCQTKGYRTVISHRSGETTDESIAHLAVAFGCHAIKTGAVGGERMAKLNELIRIEEELGEAD